MVSPGGAPQGFRAAPETRWPRAQVCAVSPRACWKRKALVGQDLQRGRVVRAQERKSAAGVRPLPAGGTGPPTRTEQPCVAGHPPQVQAGSPRPWLTLQEPGWGDHVSTSRRAGRMGLSNEGTSDASSQRASACRTSAGCASQLGYFGRGDRRAYRAGHRYACHAESIPE
jgi:hypothetical protein